jgi:hypothetical protein
VLGVQVLFIGKRVRKAITTCTRITISANKQKAGYRKRKLAGKLILKLKKLPLQTHRGSNQAIRLGIYNWQKDSWQPRQLATDNWQPLNAF